MRLDGLTLIDASLASSFFWCSSKLLGRSTSHSDLHWLATGIQWSILFMSFGRMAPFFWASGESWLIMMRLADESASQLWEEDRFLAWQWISFIIVLSRAC